MITDTAVNRVLALSVVTGSILITGCASTKVDNYSLAPDVPSAQIRSEISGANGRNDSIDIYVLDKRAPLYKPTKILGISMDHASLPSNNESRLFLIEKSKSTPSGYVQVPAGEPFQIRYHEHLGDRICSVIGSPTLEPGKKYSLKGGFKYEDGPGPMPFLTGTRKCSLGVFDEEANAFIPFFKSTNKDSAKEITGWLTFIR